MERPAFESLVENLLLDVDPLESMKHSFIDYHVPGMHYLNLLRTERLTVKMYMTSRATKFSGTDVFDDNGPLLVNPHNHAYNFHSFVLAGAVENVRFDVGTGGGVGMHMFTYDSAKREFSRHGWVGLKPRIDNNRPYVMGESYYHRWDEVHSIRPTVPNTCLVLLQYKDIYTHGTKFYSRDEKPPSLEGLYKRPSYDQTLQLMSLARSYWKLYQNHVQTRAVAAEIEELVGRRADFSV